MIIKYGKLFKLGGKMKRRIFSSLAVIFIILFVVVGFSNQKSKVSLSDVSFERRIAFLEAEIAELKEMLKKDPGMEIDVIKGGPGPGPQPLAWTEGARGWEEDGSNIWTSVAPLPLYNVGIGITSPTEKLDVNGAVNVSSFYKIGGDRVLSNGGTNNIFVGVGAGENNAGSDNTFLGDSAGFSNTSGSYNTFLGRLAGYSNTTSFFNTFSGEGAGRSNTTGYCNTFSGSRAGMCNTTGYDNTFLGHCAGYLNTTGSYNTFSGFAAGQSNTTGASNVFIGYQAGYYNTTDSSKLYIANDSSDANVLVYGEFDNRRIGIGTTTPSERLDIQDGSGNGAIRVGNTANTNTGTIRWNGSNFQGRNASTWVDLDASGGADNDWVRGEAPGIPDTVLCTFNYLGLARGGAANAVYSNLPYTHVNFGVECTTGQNNANNWVYCTISGGRGNNATWSYSTVGGGYLNDARQAYTTIGGGQGNSIGSGGSHSTIAGGYNNTADGTRSCIGGGMDNTTAGTYSTIGGGYGNTVTSSMFSRSTIAGGQLNTINSEYSAIPGGRDITVSGDYAFAFGRGVTIAAAADYHSVFYSATYPGSLLVNGDLRITGTLSKGGGSFLIDHPLDPRNKTLRHNFVESPENLCLYRGKVTLDNTGKETVKMPDYFKALTKEDEATITLTSIGKPFNTGYEWNKHFTEFTVYGESGREVSYIVLADRDDPVMRKLYRPVEEEKGNGNFVKGKLLYPEAYGYPVEMSVGYHP